MQLIHPHSMFVDSICHFAAICWDMAMDMYRWRFCSSDSERHLSHIPSFLQTLQQILSFTYREHMSRQVRFKLQPVTAAAVDLQVSTAAAAAGDVVAARQLQHSTYGHVSLSQELVLRDCCFKWKQGELPAAVSNLANL